MPSIDSDTALFWRIGPGACDQPGIGWCSLDRSTSPPTSLDPGLQNCQTSSTANKIGLASHFMVLRTIFRLATSRSRPYLASPCPSCLCAAIDTCLARYIVRSECFQPCRISWDTFGTLRCEFVWILAYRHSKRSSGIRGQCAHPTIDSSPWPIYFSTVWSPWFCSGTKTFFRISCEASPSAPWRSSFRWAQWGSRSIKSCTVNAWCWIRLGWRPRGPFPTRGLGCSSPTLCTRGGRKCRLALSARAIWQEAWFCCRVSVALIGGTVFWIAGAWFASFPCRTIYRVPVCLMWFSIWSSEFRYRHRSAQFDARTIGHPWGGRRYLRTQNVIRTGHQCHLSKG